MIIDPETGWLEPTVVINGRQLDFAEAMTLRVAVSTFRIQLSDPRMQRALGPLAGNYDHHLMNIERWMRGDK